MSEENWRDGLPEGLRDAPFLSKANSLDEAVGQIKNAADYMGNSIRIPSDEASDEQRAEFYGKLQERVPGLARLPEEKTLEATGALLKLLGQPDEASGYGDLGVEGLSAERIEAMKAAAHKAGLTDAQYRALYGSQLAAEAEAAQGIAAAKQADQDALKAAWGDAHEAKLRQVKEYAAQHAPKDLADAIDRGDIPAEHMQWLASVADSLGKGPGREGQSQQGSDPGMTPIEARARIDEIQGEIRDASPARRAQLMQDQIKAQYAADPSLNDDLPLADALRMLRESNSY